MEKSEENTQNDPAPKRPSARRVANESEPPTADPNSKAPKRVHVRRPAPATRAPADGSSSEPQSTSASARFVSLPRTHGRRSGTRASSLPPAADVETIAAVHALDVAAAALPLAEPALVGDRESQVFVVGPAETSFWKIAEEDAVPSEEHEVEDAERESSVPPTSTRPSEPPPRAALVRARAGRSELAHGVHAEAFAQPIDLGDDFGLDADYEIKVQPWLEKLCTHYVHVELRGAHNLPEQGRVLLVANHSRAPLWDGIIFRTALCLQHATRKPRWLVDDVQYHAPFLGTFVNRLGAVRACQENAERLLTREELVVVFPEGAKAAERRYEDRHRLLRFGRGGYVKLALRTGTPVIPVAIVSREVRDARWRQRLSSASRAVSAPLFALGPRFGVLGVPPLASQIRITIGEPVREIARQDVLATRDDGLVHELNECVRGAVQQLVNTSLRA
jgi:1-acyl-sn-glycerol-3-phosphate acyltransferase